MLRVRERPSKGIYCKGVTGYLGLKRVNESSHPEQKSCLVIGLAAFGCIAVGGTCTPVGIRYM